MDKTEISILIKELIEKTTLAVREVKIGEPDPLGKDKTMWFEVEMDQPHFFTGREGEALLALNHLVRRIVESKIGNVENYEEPSILVDVNGFQKKRIDNIRAIAHMMGERARYFKSNIEVDPMSAYERRIIHEFFSDVTDLKTESEGTGSTRRVVIKYLGTE